MGSKGQPAQFISRGKAYPDTKRKTRLGLKPILPWSPDVRERPSACSPRLLNWEVDYLVSWGNVSHSFRLKGILYLNYVFNLFFIFQVKQFCNLLNYLRNQFHPSAPKGRMLFQWLPLVSSLSCDFLLPEERDPLSNLLELSLGLIHLFYLYIWVIWPSVIWHCLTLYECISGSSVPRRFWDQNSLKVYLFHFYMS